MVVSESSPRVGKSFKGQFFRRKEEEGELMISRRELDGGPIRRFLEEAHASSLN